MKKLENISSNPSSVLHYDSDIAFDYREIDQLDGIDFSKNHIVPSIFTTINDCLSNNENLEKFLRNNINCKKWFVVSDYAIGDPNKNGNFVTFTLVPHYFPFISLINGINKLQPKDIKKTKVVNHEFLKFINSGLFFHISIELPDDAHRLIPNIKRHFEILLNSMLLGAKKVSEREEIQHFQRKLSRSMKTNLLFNIELIATIVSSINLQLFKAIPNLNIICWLSDRDTILTNFGDNPKFSVPSMIFNIIDVRSKALFGAVKIPFSKNLNLILSFGKPESEGQMWYDPLIRIPDYIAGTLADNDQKNMTVTKEKFFDVIKFAIADSKYHFIFRMNIDGNLVSCTETLYEKKEKI
ncbi:hypothetical protein [Acinetobacter soli]|uniref:Uncharacterized protein n=1 Tax=Acinetobacter soli TaxID=487316 RepID=A0A1P8EF87_9GAMM|nr:hypothetical protein [Acinetobacter soli]APV34860.1 hypothetical protein BEN76_02005 [Acinetobacter soli]